jgi:hypothetical protein
MAKAKANMRLERMTRFVFVCLFMFYCFLFSLLFAVGVRLAARLRNQFHPDLHGYKQWISRQAFRQVTSMHVSFPFSSS